MKQFHDEMILGKIFFQISTNMNNTENQNILPKMFFNAIHLGNISITNNTIWRKWTYLFQFYVPKSSVLNHL